MKIANIRDVHNSIKDAPVFPTVDSLKLAKQKAKKLGWAIAKDGRCYVPEANRKLR